MKEETWNKIKSEAPVIFTASFVTLFSSWLFNNEPKELISNQVLTMFFSSLIWVGIGIGSVYSLIYLWYKVTKER